MIRAAIALIALIVVAAGGALWHFRSGDTRLSKLPQIAAALTGSLPKAPAHVVVVIEENKDYDDVAGSAHAPYLNELMARGATFTHSYGVAHPSQPNYLALFAGVTNDNGDGCPPRGYDSSSPNLASELIAAHRTFAGYAEDMPNAGFTGCWSRQYARKHVPWVDFTNVPSSANLPFSAFPSYDKLPTVSFVVPNLLNDMHSASVARGDAWFRRTLGPLVTWAMKHDTLLIVTWDESDGTLSNQIPTIFIGPMVRAGVYAEPITHYRVLRTIEAFYGLKPTGAASNVQPITDVFTAVKAGT